MLYVNICSVFMLSVVVPHIRILELVSVYKVQAQQHTA